MVVQGHMRGQKLAPCTPSEFRATLRALYADNRVFLVDGPDGSYTIYPL